RRARVASVAVLHAVSARLIADGAAELFERGQVALAGEEEASPTVVPDRSRLFPAVARLDLGEVVEAEEELDTLPGSAGGVSREPRDAGEVGRLVERQEQAWQKHAPLPAGTQRGLAQEGGD